MCQWVEGRGEEANLCGFVIGVPSCSVCQWWQQACEYGWVCPSPPLPLQMTASGLGARYASLPTEKECFDDGGWWHLLKEGELQGAVPELKGMLQLLEFCDSVVKVGWWMCAWGCGIGWVGV